MSAPRRCVLAALLLCACAPARHIVAPIAPIAPVVAAAPDAAREDARPRDTDGDGVPDVDDRCPAVPEDCDGNEDDDGCPDPDDDHDGVPDVCDRCPRQPGRGAGMDPPDGCPWVDNFGSESRVTVLVNVHFTANSARLDPVTGPMLDAVAELLRQHAGLDLVGVVGHAAPGERGPAALGLRRAQATLEALVARGIDRARLEARSSGGARPLVMGDTAHARETNRRVEFQLVRFNGATQASWAQDHYDTVAAPARPTPPVPAPLPQGCPQSPPPVAPPPPGGCPR